MAVEKSNPSEDKNMILVTDEDRGFGASSQMDPRAEINLALIIAKSLPDDYFDPEGINVMSGFAVSPEFHKMLDEMVSGKLIIRDFATYCYLAGRISIAIARQP